MYFVKIRIFLIQYQEIIKQSLDNYEELKKYSGHETIYFFVIDERSPDIIKIGKTKDIIKRLRSYNVGRIKKVELKYLVLVKNSDLIENCMKEKLFDNQVYENKEIYKIEPKKIKKAIRECFCKNMTNEDNEELFEEVGELLKLYSYTKDKINIKPYVIIDKK